MKIQSILKSLTFFAVFVTVTGSKAEKNGPGTYNGYYNETRWGDKVLHLGPYHTFVSEAAGRVLMKHKGKPLEVEVTDLRHPPIGRGMIETVGEVKEKGSHQGLRIKAEVESEKVERGKGIKVEITLTNNTDKDIIIDSAQLAVVLATNSTENENEIDYEDPDGRAYWYYRYGYMSLDGGAKPMDIACHQVLLRWSDKMFSGIEVDPARNRVAKGDRITVETNGNFTASYSAAKELPVGEYELFVYVVSGNLSSLPGPMSARLPFDVVRKKAP
jgi:hypothetical protein